MNYKYIFGPVPSRRLGVSLGIDLIPEKTCTFDCIYCECGKTTALTAARKQYVPTIEVINELENYLKEQPSLDYITFSGSGEPLLHSGLGEISDYLSENYPQYKTALLTNSSLLNNSNIINSIKNIDLVIPSLDAGFEDSFQKINRPLSNLTLEHIIKGLHKLKKSYQGKIWLEIFIVPGINDSSEEIEEMNKIIQKLDPDKIQLNTLDRPGTENWVKPASKQSLKKIASVLGEKSEVIANFKSRDKIKSFDEDIKDKILQMLHRRPCTLSDLSQIMNLPKQELNKYIQTLLANDSIKIKEENRGNFFMIK